MCPQGEERYGYECRLAEAILRNPKPNRHPDPNLTLTLTLNSIGTLTISLIKTCMLTCISTYSIELLSLAVTDHSSRATQHHARYVV